MALEVEKNNSRKRVSNLMEWGAYARGINMPSSRFLVKN